MEEDSGQLDKSDQMTHNQPASQQTSSISQSFHCNHCVLLFKSKYFLLEHMEKVHGIEMDPSRSEGSCTSSESSTALHSTLYNNSARVFSCRHCVFTSSNWTLITKHERTYHKAPVRGYGKGGTLKTKKLYLRGKLLNTKVSLSGKNNQNVSAIQRKQGVKGRAISKSSSKTINIPSSSLLLKNLQAQVGSSGNISKFRVVSGTSAHESSLNSSQLKLTNLPMPSGAHGVTLRSDAPFLSYEQDKVTEERSHAEVEQKDSHCCSLCNFSATWLEDLLTHQRSNHSYLFYSMGSGVLEKQVTERQDLKSETCNEMSLNDLLNNTTKKRANDDNLPAEKKIKTSPENAVIQSRLVGGPAFTFEVSEDEEEGNASRPELDISGNKIYVRGQLKNRKSKSNRKKRYNCKHCEYSHKSYRGVSTHYQRMHPYIRFDIQYIIDPGNWTATFRCLECPVEFATPGDLKKHYRDHHPESPNVFMMRSDQLDLVYKCFACPFTISNGKYLKYHYKHKHPELEMGNHLMYCSYTAKPSVADSSKSQHLGETSSPKISESQECQETVNVNPTPPKACSVSLGVNEELYQCKHCAFSNISVVVMLVHYQKSHPKAGLTIDSIKRASLATSVKPRDETRVSPDKMNLEPFKLPEVKPNNSTLSEPNVAQKEMANLFFCQHCNYGNLTVRGVLNHQRSRHSDLKATVEQIHLYTAEVRSRKKMAPDIAVGSPKIPLQNSVAQEDVLAPFELPEVKSSNSSCPISSVSQADAKSLYFCQFCDYSNPTVRGIMNHQKLRHITRKSTAERIIKHTAVIRKKHKMRRVLNQHKSYPSHLKVTAKKVVKHAAEFHGQNEKPAYNSFKSTLEKEVDELFFCQYCNYGNPRVLGVLNHQKLRHRYLQTSTNDIIRYTSKLRNQKEKCLPAGFDSSNNSVLISDNSNEGCSLFFCQVCNYGDPSIRGILNHQKKRHCELKTDPDDVFRHTAEVRGHTNKSKMSGRVNSPNSPQMLPLPLVTEEAVLFCQFCNYSNPTMRVVVDHQRKRHPDLKTTAKQILSYTAMILVQNGRSPKSSFFSSDFVQEELDEFFCQYCDYSNCTVRGILNHHNKSHSDLETNTAQILRHTVLVRGQRTSSEAVNSSLTFTHFQNDEVDDMFFCQICNYSNPTAKGVLNHQRKKHVDIKATAKQIVEYTATLCKSKPVQEDSQPEEGTVFYCQYCDYDNPTVRGVLSHQKLKHSDQKATADQVVTYTAVVCRPNKKSKIHQPNISSMKASQSCMQKSAPLRSIKNHRSLKCRNCSYTTPHIYLLKRHLRNNHQEKAPITTIISWAYQDGYLQAGYHCEWCVCSHTEAKGLLRHYRQRHPDKNTGLESIILRLRAGPKISQPKETNLKPENDLNLEPITPRIGEVQKTSTSFQSRGDTKVYPCRACPFKATSMGGISSHYRVVHPWSVKEDGSVLDVISSRQTQEPEVQEPLDNNETSVSSETYRCPVCSSEFPTLHGMSTHCGKKHPEHDTKVHEEPDVRETSKPSLRFRCPVCPGVFNTLHGMLTHCGKKHPEHDTSTYEKVPEEEPSSSEGTLVFKCSACPYVNTRAHGVLTHSQMRHPAVKVSTERLDQEIVHFTNPDECVVVRSGRRMGLAGFRCNMCPVIHAKFKILKTHYEMDHKRSSSNMFKPAIKQSAAIKKQLISKYRGSQTSIVQAAILKKGKSIFIKCHLCKYFCTTKKGLARHLLINHSTLAQNEDREFSYKCALCSYTTLICKYLAAHYRRQHGNAAFNAHFVPAFRPLRVPPTSPNHEDSLNQEMKSPGEKIKCSCCFFQCLSEKGMVSHYAICHPGVSPVKPDSSKASPNKTAHTPLKPRPRPRHQKPVCKIFDPQCEEGNAWCPVKCKKCENLFFNSSLLLSIHYTNFHKEDFKQDFVILSKTSEDSIEFYKCEHCNIEIQGNADLSTHLDLHNDESLKLANEHRPSPQHLRDPAPNTSETQPPTPQRPSPQHLRDPAPNTSETQHPTPQRPSTEDQHERQEQPEVLTPEESDSHWIVTKVESVATGMGPLLFPSKSLRTEPEGQSVGEECKHCGRTFKSLKGLRSHERSHAATAALKRLENVPHQQKQMFDRHIRHRPGTIKPFHCTLCRYRTTILSLLKNHLLKVHGAEYPSKNLPSLVTITEDEEHTLRADEEGANLPQIQDCNQFSDSEGSDLTEKRAYSEPPDVLRQLKHYRHLAQAKAPGPPEPKSTGTTQDGLFACEFCTYTSTYIKSMRRHYISRHNGKRIVRCKDCSFFTGFRKKLDMHMETAHASVIIEAVKDLHCPLCLYHTKNKKRMIDHIILHREEPLAPIEVRRPKLSRYLQGIVFRCHKCTFTSSSDESLRLHMHKHNDLKPYKCRLCYFDCTQLSELEAHLCDMHQVMRNHELVGQVHLEELETTLNRMKWGGRCDQEPGDEEKLEGTAHLNVAKQQWLEEEGDNMELQGNEEENQEETNKMHKDKQAFKEGYTIREPGLKKSGKNIFKENKEHELKGKKNIDEQSPDCEKKRGHQDEVNQKEDNEVGKNMARTCEFHESQYFKQEYEEQYEQCHDNFEDKDGEQFTDCQEYQELRESVTGERDDRYHEMPVLENEEWKVEIHSHSEKREHEGESLKTDGPKPGCNKKGEAGKKLDANNENGYTLASNDTSTALRINPTTNENALSCDLCGRTLMSSTDLERHVLRHGL